MHYDSDVLDDEYFKIEINIEKWLHQQGLDVLCKQLSGTDAWVAAIEAQAKENLNRQAENAW